MFFWLTGFEDNFLMKIQFDSVPLLFFGCFEKWTKRRLSSPHPKPRCGSFFFGKKRPALMSRWKLGSMVSKWVITYL